MFVLRFIKNLILVLLILFIILIPILIYLVKFGNNSFIGESTRRLALGNYKLVEMLNLNEPGDAKYIYSDPQKKDILVKVVAVNYEDVNESVDDWIGEMIFHTLNKNAVIGVTENVGYPKTKLLTDADLNEIREDVFSPKPADLNVVYASSYAEKESSVGLVIHRDTIFIFRDALDALSERESIKDVLEKTTIMHEWGHLLGLGHFESEDCIMNEMVEVYDSIPSGRNLPTEYCRQELQEIKKL